MLQLTGGKLNSTGNQVSISIPYLRYELCVPVFWQLRICWNPASSGDYNRLLAFKGTLKDQIYILYSILT